MMLVSLFVFSCEKKVDLEPDAASTTSSLRDGEELRKYFAKALVKALQEKEVREFLKAEALEKYDGDYDVLYALVKNKKLASGKTFEQTLASYASLLQKVFDFL
jgi:hypothetical protein